MQAAVQNQGNGWTYTLRYLERSLDDALARATDGHVGLGDHSSYLLLVQSLAARTAELHRALALKTGDPSFDPEPFTTERLTEWADAIVGELDATLYALRARRSELPPEAREAAAAAFELAPRLRTLIEGHAKISAAGLAIRLHGDYHLGQVLITRNDFLITDLEGEPGRSLAERRRKHTVLKDLAAMRRSFDYARVVAARQFATKPGAGAMDVHAFLDDWRARVHAEFRDAYRTAIGDCPVLPPHAADERHLHVLATIERLLYEIRYELANRPGLVTVPLADLTALLAEQPAD